MSKRNHGPKKTHSQDTPYQQLKKERIPAGLRQNRLLVVDKEVDKHYRIVNDINNGANIQRFLEGGYKFSKGKFQGSQSIHSDQHDGSINVKSGRAYLMEIDKQTYKEDQKLKQGIQDQLMERIQNPPTKREGNLTVYDIGTNMEDKYGKH